MCLDEMAVDSSDASFSRPSWCENSVLDGVSLLMAQRVINPGREYASHSDGLTVGRQKREVSGETKGVTSPCSG